MSTATTGGGAFGSATDGWKPTVSPISSSTSVVSLALPASLNRRNNDGHYEPTNVAWADMKTQCRNKSNNRLLTFQGRTMTLVEWAEEVGIKRVTLSRRVNNGYSDEQALTTPVAKRKPYEEWKYDPSKPRGPRPKSLDA